jgi:hypothetical protein
MENEMMVVQHDCASLIDYDFLHHLRKRIDGHLKIGQFMR